MARLGQEFELKINQEATIEGEGLAVAFETTLEDGRCQLDVTCAWSGNAKIKVRLSNQIEQGEAEARQRRTQHPHQASKVLHIMNIRSGSSR